MKPALGASVTTLPLPGEVVLGKYRIEREIGRGGMGVVYAATHEGLGQRVALKLLLPDAARSDDAIARFLNEARAAARINNEHVPTVMDVGHLESGVAYMVLEYLEGRDLARACDEDGPLRITDAVDHVLQALVAVAQAHASGVVHRDLKPANLFLADKPGGGAIVKVLDFGISKLAGDDLRDITKTSAMLGSPAFMAPEQVRSSKSVDARADIWSVGVIFYRLLANHAPFDGENVGEVLAAILEASPRPLRELRPEVSEGLEAVVLRCLEKRREARFASAGELALALAPFASEEGAKVAQRVAQSPAPSGTAEANAQTTGQTSRSRSLPPRVSGETTVAAPSLAAAPIVATRALARDEAASIGGDVTGEVRGTPTLAAQTSITLVQQASSASRRSTWALAASLVVALVALAIVVSRQKPPSGAAGAAASGEARRWFERAPADAGPAYTRALSAMRAAFREDAASAFREATKERPALGAAYLRRAILQGALWPEETRVDFARAVENVDTLDPRDAALLDAFRHHFAAPPDDAGWVLALARLAGDPGPSGDAEMALYLGRARALVGDADGSIAAYEDAIARDPELAMAYAELAQESLEINDTARAERAIDACLALPRRSPACSMERVRILQRRGDCGGVLREAEAWGLADPQHGDLSHAFRAEALYALGRPLAAVEEAVRQRTRRLKEDRSRTRLYWDRRLAELKGDFASAERALKEQLAFAEKSSEDQRVYAAATLGLVELYEEMGRDADAAAAASDFLAKQDAWIEMRSDAHGGIQADLTPRLLAAEQRAKILDTSKHAAALGAWIDKWRAQLPTSARPALWMHGYAAVATTEELARLAVAERASLDGIDPERPLAFDGELALGRTFALAGDDARAIPHLERATRGCATLHNVIDDTQGLALLGQALETRDKARACEAYGKVLARWGRASASTTGARVAKRARDLGCP